MNPETAQPAALLQWMDSLADATRLRLLRLLEEHELGVVDLCAVLQMPQSTVSRHLKVLADEGWVVSRRRGTMNRYALAAAELPQAARKLWALAREQTDHWPALKQDELRLQRRLQQHSPDAKTFFASTAGQWEKLRRDLYGEKFLVSVLAALTPSNWTIADLGCGTGQLVAELSPHVKRVIGVDVSPAMLKAAGKRIGNARNVELREGDVQKLPLAAGCCDAALMLLVLTYVDDPAAALREMARILKPGGEAVIVDLLHHDREDFRRDLEQRWPGFATSRLIEEMNGAGFDDVVCQPLQPEPQAKGPALLLATGLKRRA